jgi:hypothetical protein
MVATRGIAMGSKAAIAAVACLLVAFARPLPAAEVTSETVMGDREFFGKVDLQHAGLELVRKAVEGNDLTAARHALAVYYRNRKGRFFTLDPQQPGKGEANKLSADLARSLVQRSGDFDRGFWDGDVYDWNAPKYRFKERMYGFGALGRAYAASANEDIAKAWVTLLRSFVLTCPRSKTNNMWNSMDTGIRMRTGWPEAFHCFLHSPSFGDDEMILFLKSVYEQTNHIRYNHDPTSNWLTFAMAGLYTSGAMYPEFRDATDWRKYASNTAVNDMQRGWLPDGMTIELTPGYGQFFSNYYHIYDLAEFVGRLDEFNLREFVARTEAPYECFLRIMAPDRFTPATNDNGPQDVPAIMKGALRRFPNHEDFRWAATDGKEGRAPNYTSIVLPYAGFAAMRSGWKRDDNMLYFDFGPVGYRHAHQDKLEVIVWAYGRQILFDPGRSDYSDSPHSNYALDTFSHSTVLVNNCPQRRTWYKDPNPQNMPYQKRGDYVWETTADHDYAAGRYEDAYGMPGESDAYPYKKGGNFEQRWGHPATHYRRVWFQKPDVFVVADDVVSSEVMSLNCDVRWHLDTTHTLVGHNGLSVETADAGRPNLQIAALFADGLTTKATSAQDKPEILGWKITTVSQPATTLQHLKSGSGTVRFLTLLLPLKPGQAGLLAEAVALNADAVRITLTDGRKLKITAPADPAEKLTVRAE